MIVFISITIIFIFNIILISKVTYFYWFVIVFSFLLIRFAGISNCSAFSFIASFSFSSLKRFLISFIAMSFFAFFTFFFLAAGQGLFTHFLNMLDIRDIIFLPYTVSGRRFLGDTTQYASPWAGSPVCHLFNVFL